MQATASIQRESIISSVIQFHNCAYPTVSNEIQSDPKEEKTQVTENGFEGIFGKETQEILEEDTRARLVEKKTQEEWANRKYKFNVFSPSTSTDYRFGTLTIKVSELPPIPHDITIDSNIDISLSMGEKASTCGQSKMHFANLIYKNIATATANANKSNGTSVFLSIHGFDNQLDTILTDTKITPDNIVEIRSKIDLLQPRGATDIGLAIQKQQERAETRETLQVNITITDGNITAGVKSYDMIKEYIKPNQQNYYIGLGSNHNSKGLQTLADSQPNSGYYYIAEAELAYIAFGEILNRILYTVINDGYIEVFEGEIYDIETNRWINKIPIESMTSQQEITYYVRSKTPLDFNARIYGKSTHLQDVTRQLLEDEISTLPSLINEDKTIEKIDLSYHMLKMKTQEYVFKAHQFNVKARNPTDYIGHLYFAILRNEMIQFRKFLHEYKTEKQVDSVEDLISDIDVILKTLGGNRGHLYSCAKYNAHRQNRSHGVNTIEPKDVMKYDSVDIRQRAMERERPTINSNWCNENAPTSVKIGRAYTQEMTTPTLLGLMRSLSDGMSQTNELNDTNDHQNTV
jgi:hypothetical protein